MIDRREILDARDLGLEARVVEKDYVLGWLLAGIYSQDRLRASWVFKGGTRTARNWRRTGRRCCSTNCHSSHPFRPSGMNSPPSSNGSRRRSALLDQRRFPSGPIFIPDTERSATTVSGRVGRTHHPFRRTGPTYVYQCTLCGKKFRRRNRDSGLREHKTPDGWACRGRRGHHVALNTEPDASTRPSEAQARSLRCRAAGPQPSFQKTASGRCAAFLPVTRRSTSPSERSSSVNGRHGCSSVAALRLPSMSIGKLLCSWKIRHAPP